MSKLRNLLVSLAAAGLVGSAAFAQDEVVSYPGLDMVPGQVGGTMRLSLASTPPTFFYYGDLSNDIKLFAQQIFDTLVEFDLENYELVPGLATSWDVSDDGLVYTFHLREGVTWHDGTPFTAADVEFTLNQIVANPEARAGDAAVFVQTVDGESVPVEVVAVDDHTVEITLAAPSAAFVTQLRSFFIMPKHALLEFSEEGGADASAINDAWPTNGDPTDVIGTGPYRLTAYTPGQLVNLERYDSYWKVDEAGTRLPYVETLQFLVISGTEAQTAQFLAGNLDQLNISGGQFPDFKSREVAGEPFSVIVSEALFGSPPHLAFNFNAADPELAEIFSDSDFRRAMEYAVNRDRIIDDVYNGLATWPGSPTAPVNGAFYEDTTEIMHSFDLDAAAAALDELGITDTDGDGIRNLASGNNLEFTLTYGNDSATWTDVATILQNDFEQIGVRAHLQGIQSANLLSQGMSGDFEAIVVAIGNQPDPELRKPIWQPGGSLYYWHRATQPAEPGGPANTDAFLDYEHRLYEIFDLGSTLGDQAQRAELYREWQRINAEEALVIMIAKPSNIAAVYNHVGNFVYSLGVIPGYNPVPFYFVND